MTDWQNTVTGKINFRFGSFGCFSVRIPHNSTWCPHRIWTDIGQKKRPPFC